MNPAFSSGFPRRGQWCLLPDGSLCIASTPRDVADRTGQPATGGRILSDPDKVHVAVVNETTGFDAGHYGVVPLSALRPLLDRNRIPAPRLATMAPGWNPKR